MVFHLTRTDDPTKQDIVCMDTIISPVTNRPSWAKLVGILEQEGDFDLGFKEGRDFITTNGNIRVANKRQFLASVQYLYNLKIWSSEALVDSFDKVKKKEGLSRSRSLENTKSSIMWNEYPMYVNLFNGFYWSLAHSTYRSAPE